MITAVHNGKLTPCEMSTRDSRKKQNKQTNVDTSPFISYTLLLLSWNSLSSFRSALILHGCKHSSQVLQRVLDVNPSFKHPKDAIQHWDPETDDLNLTTTVAFKQSSTGREKIERTVTGWIHALMYTKLWPYIWMAQQKSRHTFLPVLCCAFLLSLCEL